MCKNIYNLNKADKTFNENPTHQSYIKITNMIT